MRVTLVKELLPFFLSLVTGAGQERTGGVFLPFPGVNLMVKKYARGESSCF
jgi:hypothetical protein